MASSRWLKRSRNRSVPTSISCVWSSWCPDTHRIFSLWNPRCDTFFYSMWRISQEDVALCHILTIRTCKKKREFNFVAELHSMALGSSCYALQKGVHWWTVSVPTAAAQLLTKCTLNALIMYNCALSGITKKLELGCSSHREVSGMVQAGVRFWVESSGQ